MEVEADATASALELEAAPVDETGGGGIWYTGTDGADEDCTAEEYPVEGKAGD